MKRIIICLCMSLFLGLGIVGCNNNNLIPVDEIDDHDLMPEGKAACDNNDFERARQCLHKLSSVARYGLSEEYQDLGDYLFTSESQYLIAHIDEEDAVDRICYLITSITALGSRMPTNQFLTSNKDDAKEYYRYVSEVNMKSEKLFDLAIGINNETLAKRILVLFKEDYTVVETFQNGHPGFVVYSSTDTKDSAKKRYLEAFGNAATAE